MIQAADPWGAAWRRSSRRWRKFGKAVEQAAGWLVWNPGEYGEKWHSVYRSVYPHGRHPLVVFGLNPGPYGMAQTGIPFTDVKRLRSALPKFAKTLEARDFGVEVPGLAPSTLQPFLSRTFESSSVRIYRFLEEAFGSAEKGCRDVVVANPCPLLFISPETGKNVTPADLGRAVRARGKRDARALLEELNELRAANCKDTLETLQPRGVVLLGRDVQAALGELLRDELGEAKVVDWEHPARAVPEKWSRGLINELKRRKLLRAKK